MKCKKSPLVNYTIGVCDLALRARNIFMNLFEYCQILVINRKVVKIHLKGRRGNIRPFPTPGIVLNIYQFDSAASRRWRENPRKIYPGPMKFPKWQYLVLILLLAVLVRSPVLKSQFIYETYLGLEYLEKLPASEIFGIGRLTIPERKVDSAVPYGNFYFRPAIAVPMALGKWLGGYDPLALSMVGLAIHCINVALVCLLLTGSGWTAKRSLAATILFAVSPLNTLPIAFAGGYSFMLFAMFTMVSFIFFRRSLEGNRRCLDLFLSVGA